MKFIQRVERLHFGDGNFHILERLKLTPVRFEANWSQSSNFNAIAPSILVTWASNGKVKSSLRFSIDIAEQYSLDNLLHWYRQTWKMPEPEEREFIKYQILSNVSVKMNGFSFACEVFMEPLDDEDLVVN
ncbi:unnamed protein product [Rhizophagus irregularis]|nr:unnamed protein product [Rhizophagus irregularis]